MRVVGLTGQMAVGKSTVSSYLHGKGALVLDCDSIAKDLVERGSPGWAAVLSEFGQAYILEDGKLDRAALGRTVFADSHALGVLNSLLHPLLSSAVAQEVEERSGRCGVCVVDAAVLIESGMWRLCDEVWLVWASADTQIMRLMERNGLSLESAQARVAAQTPPVLARAFSAHVVDTTAGYVSTYAQVDVLYEGLAVT